MTVDTTGSDPRTIAFPRSGSAAGGLCTLIGLVFVGLHWTAHMAEEHMRHHGRFLTLFGILLFVVGLYLMGTRKSVRVTPTQGGPRYQIGTRIFGVFYWWHRRTFDSVSVTRHLPQAGWLGHSTVPIGWSVLLSSTGSKHPVEIANFPTEGEARAFTAQVSGGGGT